MKACSRLLALLVTGLLVIGALTISGTAASAAEPSPAAGTWVGTYTCPQGLTGLRLEVVEEPGGVLAATFNFYPVPSNPGVPSGRFTMRGGPSGAGILLTQERWVEQPPGYFMVDLRSVPIAPGAVVLTGAVVTQGCGTFTLWKMGTLVPPPLLPGLDGARSPASSA